MENVFYNIFNIQGNVNSLRCGISYWRKPGDLLPFLGGSAASKGT